MPLPTSPCLYLIYKYRDVYMDDPASVSVYQRDPQRAAFTTDLCMHLWPHMALWSLARWLGVRMGCKVLQTPGKGSVFFQSLCSLTASCLTGWGDLS